MANSTPNYGYDSDVPAISGIDRDLKRIEDKADANTQQLNDFRLSTTEKMTRNEDGIACLDKRVDKLECIPATICRKTDMDCGLVKKVDKCDFKMHLRDPAAHKKMLDRKVDKKRGCRLICEDEVKRIHHDISDRYTKEETYSKGETYSKEELYTQEEVDALLANKANIAALTEYNCELVEGLIAHKKCTVTKWPFGMVTLHLSVHAETEPIPHGMLITTLPEVFWPRGSIESAATVSAPGVYGAAAVAVQPDGGVYIYHSMENCNFAHANVTFLAKL